MIVRTGLDLGESASRIGSRSRDSTVDPEAVIAALGDPALDAWQRLPAPR
jgi:hypothetical protein